MATLRSSDQGVRVDRPFRLLDLPQEIQDNIYSKYFENTAIEIVADDNTKSGIPQPRFGKLPALSIESTSKKVYADARAVRNKTWSYTVIVSLPVIFKDVVDIFANEAVDMSWIRKHIHAIHIKRYVESSGNYSLSNFMTSCPNLKSFHFEKQVFVSGAGTIPTREFFELARSDWRQFQQHDFFMNSSLDLLAKFLHERCDDDYQLTRATSLEWRITTGSVSYKSLQTCGYESKYGEWRIISVDDNFDELATKAGETLEWLG